MPKKRAYVILGMKRSGHHAILHWVCYNFKCAIHHNDYKIYNNKFIPAHPKQKPIIFGEGDPNVLVYNSEDFPMKNLDKLLNLKVWNNYNTQFILVMRDPYNWIASSLKAGGGLAKNLIRRIDIYKEQAKIVFQKYHPIVLPLNYNDWVQSEDYRKRCAKALHLPSYDKGVKKVSVRGGGSSFDKLKFKKDATKMDLFNRWKAYATNPIFQLLKNDDELKAINNKFFHINLDD